MTLPTIRSLWIGSSLGPLDCICLSSFVRAGHQVELFTYEDVSNIPAGVIRRDGREILPEDRITAYSKSGSPALFANFFRFVMIAREGGLWVDTDVFCCRPFDFSDADYVFGREDHRVINCAVFGAPKDSDLLAFLHENSMRPPFFPRWATPRTKTKILGGILLNKYRRFQDGPWGTFGPEMLTVGIKRFGLMNRCQPRDVFYPIGTKDTDVLFGPAEQAQAQFSPKTLGVHLWNQLIADRAQPPYPPGSYLEKLFKAYS
ncbi:MAG: glycosyltransferase [Alphaproteobacteria bacterium]